MTIEIKAFWDEEAAVWVAESDDVPGLITEAATMERLIERLQTLIPELMGLNCGKTGPFPFHVVSERNAVAQAA